MMDTMPPNSAPTETTSPEPILRPEARVVRADRSLAAMVLVICTLGGTGVGFGFAMYLMRAQLAFTPMCGPHVVSARPAPITWLGVRIQNLSDHSGSIVRSVLNDTAAAAAGLQPDDVITSFDGGDIRDIEDLVTAIRARDPGDVVPIGLERHGRPLVLRARLGAR
jgi:S1-C subfamily serine protease